MNAPQKTHCADDETLEYIADLEQERARLQERCRAIELSARKSAEQAEDLKDALRFYASEENYYAKLVTPEDELYHVVLIPVCDDRGEIARRVLQNG